MVADGVQVELEPPGQAHLGLCRRSKTMSGLCSRTDFGLEGISLNSCWNSSHTAFSLKRKPSRFSLTYFWCARMKKPCRRNTGRIELLLLYVAADHHRVVREDPPVNVQQERGRHHSRLGHFPDPPQVELVGRLQHHQQSHHLHFAEVPAVEQVLQEVDLERLLDPANRGGQVLGLRHNTTFLSS